MKKTNQGLELRIMSEQEIEAIVHALTNEYDRVRESGGDQYGCLELCELDELILELRRQPDKANDKHVLLLIKG